ncbi:Uncharacterised protein [Vibrio cholerae]|nr:Uncharacterised protein [Vibrio cholerae]
MLFSSGTVHTRFSRSKSAFLASRNSLLRLAKISIKRRKFLLLS